MDNDRQPLSTTVNSGLRHRGLSIQDLPGKLRRVEAAMRWVLFKRGVWPPVGWQVPESLVGVALMQMLEERHGAFYGNVGKGQVGRKKGKAGGLKTEN